MTFWIYLAIGLAYLTGYMHGRVRPVHVWCSLNRKVRTTKL